MKGHQKAANTVNIVKYHTCLDKSDLNVSVFSMRKTKPNQGITTAMFQYYIAAEFMDNVQRESNGEGQYS